MEEKKLAYAYIWFEHKSIYDIHMNGDNEIE